MTLSNTYQSCKNSLASKLTNKGVTASGSEGLTTLINKIDNIVTSGLDANSVNLYADKHIGQSGDTVNLYALVLKNGKLANGEIVNFFIDGDGTTYDSRVLTANTATTVSKKYSIALPSTVTGYVYLESSKNILILYVSSSSNYLTIYPTGGSPTIIYDVVGIEYANNVLTVTEDDDTVTEIDCSSYDMSSLTSTVTGVVVNDYGAISATTNSVGIATVAYVCDGSGLHSVKAICGTLQSVPYPLIDGTFYDDGVSGTATWDTSSSINSDRTSGSYTELTSSSTGFIVKNITDSICIEFDYYCTDTSEKGISIRQSSSEVMARTLAQLGVNANTWCHVKLVLDDGYYSIFVDGVDKTPSSHTISTFNRFFFRVTSSYNIRYKNFVVYPI